MHRNSLILTTLLSLPITQVAFAAMSETECAVWERERSFAQTVVDHDEAAFAAHLHPGAVFFAGSGPVHGREAVTAGWLPFIKGEGIVLRWHPETVTVAVGTDTAVSRGPYWMEEMDADGEPRHRIGQFVSVWQRNVEGVWQVVFDGAGASAPKAATAEEIEQLIDSLPGSCPVV